MTTVNTLYNKLQVKWTSILAWKWRTWRFPTQPSSLKLEWTMTCLSPSSRSRYNDKIRGGKAPKTWMNGKIPFGRKCDNPLNITGLRGNCPALALSQKSESLELEWLRREPQCWFGQIWRFPMQLGYRSWDNQCSAYLPIRCLTNSGGEKSPRGPMKINDATLLERNKSVTVRGGHVDTLYDRPRLKEPLFAWKTSVCSHSA